MRTLLLAAAACAAVTATLLNPAPASGAKPAEKLFPYEMTVEKLPNGMTLVVVPMKSPGLMAYYTLVRVGSRNEVEAGKTGFAHFFEHMMFRGTKTYSQDARNAFLKKIGADDNGFTTDDFTAYTVFGSSSDMAKLVEIEADRIQNLEYAKQEFQTEARAVLGEYNKSISDPSLALEEKMAAGAFGKHTYRHTTIGFLKDIKDMPNAFDYSKTFFKRFYRPDNVTVFVTGDVNAAEISKLVTQHYGTWSGKSAAPAVPVEPKQTKERKVEVRWETETNPRIMVGYHVPAEDLAKKDTAVQLVLGEILLGRASKLHRDLVLERALVQSFSNWTFAHRDPHLFVFQVTLKDEKDRAEVWKTLEAEIDAIAGGQVDEKLLADAISNARYSVLTGLETPNSVASQVLWFAGPSGDPYALEKTLANAGTVTAADVTAFAQEHLTDANRTVVSLKSAPKKMDPKKAGGAK